MKRPSLRPVRAQQEGLPSSVISVAGDKGRTNRLCNKVYSVKFGAILYDLRGMVPPECIQLTTSCLNDSPLILLRCCAGMPTTRKDLKKRKTDKIGRLERQVIKTIQAVGIAYPP